MSSARVAPLGEKGAARCEILLDEREPTAQDRGCRELGHLIGLQVVVDQGAEPVPSERVDGRPGTWRRCRLPAGAGPAQPWPWVAALQQDEDLDLFGLVGTSLQHQSAHDVTK